jgi:small subunit ribosomal protein S13
LNNISKSNEDIKTVSPKEKNEDKSDIKSKVKNMKKINEKTESQKDEYQTQKNEKNISSEKKHNEKSMEKIEIKKETKEEIKTKKEDKKKKTEKDDFRYIVRIANTDIDGEKTLTWGLTSIKGIGMHMSTFIIDMTGLNRDLKMGKLTDDQIEKIKGVLEKVNKTAPNWMLNHRRDIESGKDIHLIGSEIDMRLRDEINIMKKIRSYKGIRHERGLTVRGQRTRANNRKGLALGVSKKRVQSGK